ncbi:hypothetical protein AB1Y20_001431 [Prymnesium parvum]|uniref:Uncharacterized protein n=1 Tax=Prymnesium parvum TaxID=97485 RepID=A0AB34KDP0_PRYPA
MVALAAQRQSPKRVVAFEEAASQINLSPPMAEADAVDCLGLAASTMFEPLVQRLKVLFCDAPAVTSLDRRGVTESSGSMKKAALSATPSAMPTGGAVEGGEMHAGHVNEEHQVHSAPSEGIHTPLERETSSRMGCSAPLDIPLRRYRQDTTHPGVPTTGAPARWSKSITELPCDLEDDCNLDRSTAEPQPERTPSLTVSDLASEELFVLETVQI